MCGEMPHLDLPYGVQCRIAQSCLSVECCMDVHIIKRSVRTYLSIDTCEFALHTAIGAFDTTILLNNYSFGQWKTVQVEGIFQIE